MVSGSLNQANDFSKQQEHFFSKRNKGTSKHQIVTNQPLKEFEEDEFADF